MLRIMFIAAPNVPATVAFVVRYNATHLLHHFVVGDNVKICKRERERELFSFGCSDCNKKKAIMLGCNFRSGIDRHVPNKMCKQYFTITIVFVHLDLVRSLQCQYWTHKTPWTGGMPP